MQPEQHRDTAMAYPPALLGESATSRQHLPRRCQSVAQLRRALISSGRRHIRHIGPATALLEPTLPLGSGVTSTLSARCRISTSPPTTMALIEPRRTSPLGVWGPGQRDLTASVSPSSSPQAGCPGVPPVGGSHPGAQDRSLAPVGAVARRPDRGSAPLGAPESRRDDRRGTPASARGWGLGSSHWQTRRVVRGFRAPATTEPIASTSMSMSSSEQTIGGARRIVDPWVSFASTWCSSRLSHS